jgi:DNA-binding winged helix-turn-helix (wHTH) protein
VNGEHSRVRTAQSDAATIADFRIGTLSISASRRTILGPAGVRHLQPQVMAVFLCLARQIGQVVSRNSLFDDCWGNAAVGDNSLNRTLTAIRHALEAVAGGEVTVETVPRTGYRLVERASASEQSVPLSQAMHDAYACWRLALPEPDPGAIASLEAALRSGVTDSAHLGMLALLLRKAAEYCDADECGAFVARCEAAARRALAIDRRDANARVALIGLTPLFGNWSKARMGLLEVLHDHSENIPALHDLAVLEMTTGRPSVAAPIIEQLVARDELAATFHYKRMYHLWTLGDAPGAEQLAARSIQLWPRHPAIWHARFWTLLGTRRAEQARDLVRDPDNAAPLPSDAAAFLEQVALAASAMQSGSLEPAQLSLLVECALSGAARGPAQAVSGLMALCALNVIDETFDVARGYYLGVGLAATPLRWNARDPSITDQHRRVTQPLFIPSAAGMRQDPRFLPLCDDMGLTAYWDEFGIEPDFLSANSQSMTAQPLVCE